MSKLKVLIVVDVQNCFITGGSMGGDLANLNMMQEIADLIKKNNYNVVVFTRDSHPINHKSFGIFPNHCRDTDKESCESSNQVTPDYKTTISDAFNKLKINVDLSEKNKNKIIKGTELSYLYYAIPELKDKVFDPNYEIHINNKKNTKKDPVKDNRIIKKINNNNKEIIVHLQKGEYCNYDAYSAFNYHVHYDEKTPEEIGTDYKKSTGLIEFLLLDEIINDKSEIEIDVCGLVGNICVINTVLQGCALFKQIIVHLQKGEYCNYDAYSAFNYHVHYDEKIPKEIGTDYNKSTGLAEFLLMDKIIGYNSNIEIDVCGLVGNICVINTVLQGCALFKQINNNNNNNNKSNVMCKFEMCSLSKINQVKNITFNYHYIKGTRFLPEYKGIDEAQMSDKDEELINDFVNNEIDELNKNESNKDIQLAKDFELKNGIISIIVSLNDNKSKKNMNNSSQDQSMYFYKYMKYKQKYRNIKFN